MAFNPLLLDPSHPQGTSQLWSGGLSHWECVRNHHTKAPAHCGLSPASLCGIAYGSAEKFPLKKTLCGIFSSWRGRLEALQAFLCHGSGGGGCPPFSLGTYLWLTGQNKLSQNETEIGCRLELFFKGQTKMIMQTPEVCFRRDHWRQNPLHCLQRGEQGMAQPGPHPAHRDDGPPQLLGMHWASGGFGDGNWHIPDKQGPEGNIFIYFLDSVNNHPCLQPLFYVN